MLTSLIIATVSVVYHCNFCYSNLATPYRKHKFVCGCYKLVDKANYNLVAAKVVTPLLPHCYNLGN